ncbi:MAG: hypothetical protein LBV71_19145 [Prevotella sp.]|jgi:hypothetical protein|nr:hypothetical protein [Prevotella sp.]
MQNNEAYQQELRDRINHTQKFIQERIVSLENLWNVWLSGSLGDDEDMLRMILELLLLASQIPEGKSLFISALEHSKKNHPQLADELWEAFDDWDKIHKTDFFWLE